MSFASFISILFKSLQLLAFWPVQEKVRITAELVQLCEKEEVHYLAQCLIHR